MQRAADPAPRQTQSSISSVIVPTG
jgi:hypothetical protein